ncbi:MAG: M14 family zinc carboxypeptidase [Bacillota bacterium]|nr:M14 family zinc carboxypeptidase [Bacillota bacterium]
MALAGLRSLFAPERPAFPLTILLAAMLATSVAHFAAPMVTGPVAVRLEPEGGERFTLTVAPAEPPMGFALDFLSYPSSAAVEAFCRELAAAYPHLVQVTEIGRSNQGRPILCLRLAAGEGDPDTRPALEMDGQHHAREPIGQQAVLYTVWHLVSGYGSDPLATHLLDTRTVYAVPVVNPDGNEVFLNEYWAQRKNARPTDEDGDGRLDEDLYDGVSGWSVHQVYEVRFDSLWLALHPNDPFVPGWYHAARRTNLGFYDEDAGEFVPQLDNDGDGKTNEDPPGGVDLNRNYPAGWERCSSQPETQIYRGPAPWSEPETRAIRDLFDARPNIRLAISYHSGDDRLAVPGIPGEQLTADEALLERIGIKASELTEAYGYRGTRHQHGSARADGETRAWLYERGVVPWLVEAYGGGEISKWRWIHSESGLAWAYYHTGLRFNPPPEGILDVCRRWLGYNLYTLAAVPCPRPGQPSLDAVAGMLRLPVANDGMVPVDVTLRAWAGSVALAVREIEALGAAGYEVSWLLGSPGQDAAAALAGGAPLRIELSVGGPSRQYPAPPLVSEWIWNPAAGPGGAAKPPQAVTGPPAGRFLDIGLAFGPAGWDADAARWDDDYYHLGRFLRPVQVVP